MATVSICGEQFFRGDDRHAQISMLDRAAAEGHQALVVLHNCRHQSTDSSAPRLFGSFGTHEQMLQWRAAETPSHDNLEHLTEYVGGLRERRLYAVLEWRTRREQEGGGVRVVGAFVRTVRNTLLRSRNSRIRFWRVVQSRFRLSLSRPPDSGLVGAEEVRVSTCSRYDSGRLNHPDGAYRNVYQLVWPDIYFPTRTAMRTFLDIVMLQLTVELAAGASQPQPWFPRSLLVHDGYGMPQSATLDRQHSCSYGGLFTENRAPGVPFNLAARKRPQQVAPSFDARAICDSRSVCLLDQLLYPWPEHATSAESAPNDFLVTYPRQLGGMGIYITLEMVREMGTSGHLGPHPKHGYIYPAAAAAPATAPAAKRSLRLNTLAPSMAMNWRLRSPFSWSDVITLPPLPPSASRSVYEREDRWLVAVQDAAKAEGDKSHIVRGPVIGSFLGLSTSGERVCHARCTHAAGHTIAVYWLTPLGNIFALCLRTQGGRANPFEYDDTEICMRRCRLIGHICTTEQELTLAARIAKQTICTLAHSHPKDCKKTVCGLCGYHSQQALIHTTKPIR